MVFIDPFELSQRNLHDVLREHPYMKCERLAQFRGAIADVQNFF